MMLILVKTSLCQKTKDGVDDRKRSNGGITIVNSDHASICKLTDAIACKEPGEWCVDQ